MQGGDPGSTGCGGHLICDRASVLIGTNCEHAHVGFVTQPYNSPKDMDGLQRR